MSNPPPPEGNPFGPDNESEGKSNPFASPNDVRDSALDVPVGADAGIVQSAGSVRQVRPVAIFAMVQGALMALIGLAVAGMGVFFANMSTEAMGEDGAALEAMQPMMGWMYGIIGVVVFLVGLLTIYAGLRLYAFRGRTFGIVMMSVGLLSVFTCYCAPTGIALAIWGLIVLLNPSVSRAFSLVSEGAEVKDILAMVRKPGT